MSAPDPERAPPGLQKVLVVGAGLIGTSIGLALRQRFVDVALQDNDPGRLALAQELARTVDYLPVDPGGARRAATLLAEMF